MYEIDKLILYASEEFGLVQSYTEIYEFSKFYRALNCKNVLEIGTYMGGMFCILCKLSSPYGKKISIDYPFYDGQDAEMTKRNVISKMKSLSPDVKLIIGDSHDKKTVDELTSALNGELLDFIFIDGDHTYEGVKMDFEYYSKFVKNGGYIGFHDIVDTESHRNYNCYVSRYWNELINSNKFIDKYEFISHYNSCGIGVLRINK